MIRKLATCAAIAGVACLSAAAPVAAATAHNNATSVGKASKGVHTDAASNVSGWAIVEADGTLARGSNVVSTGRPGFDDGAYEVIMNSKLKKCAFTATLGSSAAADPAPGGIIVSPRGGNIKGVYVHTTDVAGNPLAQAFHLVVTCS